MIQTIDNKIQLLKTILDKLKEQKKGLMQVLQLLQKLGYNSKEIL